MTDDERELLEEVESILHDEAVRVDRYLQFAWRRYLIMALKIAEAKS